MMRNILIGMVFAGFVAPLSAQVLIGKIKIGDLNFRQQRLTLSCPFFDPQEGWAKEKSIYTLHILESPPEGHSARAPTEHGLYSFFSNRWVPFKGIDTNRIYFESYTINLVREVMYDYNSVGGSRRKGERETSSDNCGQAYRFIQRNTLELVFELDSPIRPPKFVGGTRHQCEGMKAVPDGETVIKSQCEILPYRPPPNRIGF